MNEKACCAHSKVVLKHTDYPDGTRSDYWECDSGCGCRFYPEHVDMNIRRLRDFFAGQSLAFMVEMPVDPDWEFFLHTAARAYGIADAMIAERDKK